MFSICRNIRCRSTFKTTLPMHGYAMRVPVSLGGSRDAAVYSGTEAELSITQDFGMLHGLWLQCVQANRINDQELTFDVCINGFAKARTVVPMRQFLLSHWLIVLQ